MVNLKPASLREIAAWSSDPTSRRRFSALTDECFLLLDANDTLEATADQRALAWLRQLPCPVIAVGEPSSTDILSACDVTVTDLDAAAVLVETIRMHPIAASILIQTLRAAEHLSLEDALIVESMAYATLQSGAEYQAWLAKNCAPAPARHSDDGNAVEISYDGTALILELNRPSLRNAMTVEMRDALVDALHLALADDQIKHLRISGRGRCFSTGGDLSEFGTVPDPATGHVVRSLALPGRLLAACGKRAEVHVHGACVGSGVEFPAFASRITAAPNAHFQLPELRFGLIPGAGGCVSVARRIGRHRTAWLVLSRKRINARTALEWHLVDSVTSS